MSDMILDGAAVRARREALGMTPTELAAKCGCAQATISRYESGDRKNPTGTILVRLAKALRVRERELLKEEG